MGKPEYSMISIVIPVFNRAHLIGETLQSILNQTYTNWECIVVDDGSADKTVEVVANLVKTDDRFQIHRRPADLKKGANACRNYGFSLSKGEYIQWFDSDDIMLPEKLETQVFDLVNSNFNFNVCQTLVFESETSNVVDKRDSLFSENPLEDFICNRIKWLTQAPLFKRDFLVKNELKFNPDLQQSQERDYFIKVLGIDSSYSVIPKVLVLFRKHKDSISSSSFTKEKWFSNFLVNLQAREMHSDFLTVKANLYLEQALSTTIFFTLQDGFYSLAYKMYFKILKSPYISSNIFKINLLCGILTYRFLKKGYFFFKR